MVGRLAGGARALQHLDNVVVMTPARNLQRRHTMVVGVFLVSTRQVLVFVVVFVVVFVIIFVVIFVVARARPLQ